MCAASSQFFRQGRANPGTRAGDQRPLSTPGAVRHDGNVAPGFTWVQEDGRVCHHGRGARRGAVVIWRSDPISPQSPPIADLAQDRRRQMSIRPSPRKRPRRSGSSRSPLSAVVVGVVLLVAVTTTFAVLVLRSQYTFSLQSPVRLHFRWPLVVAAKTAGEDAAEAQADQFGHRLTAYQQYACNKFGSACGVALAIERAENPRGACEIYHYNSDGTLDWGYFQITTVHLTRVGLNLRDLLDCRANIDYAYLLYQERGFQPWSTYNNGAYKRFLRSP